MKIVLFLIIILIFKSLCRIDYNNEIPIEKKQCNNGDFHKDYQENWIKYLSVIQFFISDAYRDDQQYYYKITVQVKILENFLKNDQSNIQRTLQNYQHRFKEFRLLGFIQNSQDKSNSYDNSVEQAYTQLLEINNFIDLLQKSVQFLEFKTVQRDYTDAYIDYMARNFYDKVLSNNMEFLKRDYYICTGDYFEIDLKQVSSQTFSYEQFDDLSQFVGSVDQSNLLQTSTQRADKLKNFDNEIKIEDCPQKISQIISQHLHYKQLYELSEFKSNFSKELQDTFQQFFEQQEQFLIDLHSIKDVIQNFSINTEIVIRLKKLRELITDKGVNRIFFDELNQNEYTQAWYDDKQRDMLDNTFGGFLSARYQIYPQIEKYLELFNHSIQFFTLDSQYFKKLQQSFESLISYIEKFQYQSVNIQQGIKHFERDVKLCQSEIRQQNLAKFCQKKLVYIDQKIYQYQQARELYLLKKQINNYDNIFKTIKSRQDIFEAIEKLEQFQQNFLIEEKLYHVQVYPTHQNPEDKESVNAYLILIKLQNLIVHLQNAFLKADEFLDFDINIINSFESKYQNLKNNINDKTYLQKYSFATIVEQLHNLSKDQELCQKNNIHSKIILKDYSNIKNFYWLEKEFTSKHPKNLINLPQIYEFDEEDITNYRKLSDQCQADIKPLIEDIIETLKIMELLKYQEQGQNQFNKLILQAEQFQSEFLEQARILLYGMEDLKIWENLIYFNLIKKQSMDQELQSLFNQLHIFNDNLGYFAYSYQNSKDLLKYNSKNFQKMRQLKSFIDNYFQQQKYQLKDKQKELLELYHEYKACTGQEFLIDFCEAYEEQNIYGGICQQNCFDGSKKSNNIQLDAKIENKQIKKNRQQKLHGQKKNIQKKTN